MSAAGEGPPTDGNVARSDRESSEVVSRPPRVYKFGAKFVNQTVLFHVVMLEGSAFVWVGTSRLGLNDLQVATPTPYDPLPSVATLRGDMEGPGAGIAQKLSRRFGILVFLSFNLDSSQPELVLFTQKELGAALAELLRGGEPAADALTAEGASASAVG
mmetsp:Transcript_11683/g.26532  ORF Transcript_11683/g.26532 Transcript_11683/m.26532 type:complete len:159 (-) Transcript_11683:53-529(-)